MPMPSKPVALLKLEGKSHRTKTELEHRERAEEALLSGEKISAWPETRADKLAMKHFRRVTKLLGKIGKNEALYEAVINRYCCLLSECAGLETERKQLLDQLQGEGGVLLRREDPALYKALAARLGEIDRTLNQKRKMLFDIEKENVMTAAAALRSIPKTPPDKEMQDEVSRDMNDLLSRGVGRR